MNGILVIIPHVDSGIHLCQPLARTGSAKVDAAARADGWRGFELDSSSQKRSGIAEGEGPSTTMPIGSILGQGSRSRSVGVAAHAAFGEEAGANSHAEA